MNREPGYLIVALAVSVAALAPDDLHDFPLDPRLRPFAACIAVVWIGLRLGMFLRVWKSWRQWRHSPRWSFHAADLPFESVDRWLPRSLAKALYRCLPRRVSGWLYPDKGIFLGRAFQWSNEHTQELEDYLHKTSKPLPMGSDARLGYPALHAVGMKKERPLVLPWGDLNGHMLFGGTTRSGKTRGLEVVLAEAIRGPGTVIVIDPKGDTELFIRAASQARTLGRGFAFFSPAFPEESATFNPFSTCDTPTELAARVQALMPGGGAMGKDPFFTEYPLAIIERLGEAQKAVGERWTIEGLHAVTTLVQPLEDLIARYLNEVVFERDEPSPPLEELIAEYRESGIRDSLADALMDDHDKPREYFQKVTANLTPAFRGVTGRRMRRLLSSADPDLSWDGIVKNRTVVYFSMNSLMFGEVANRIGRVILQDLIGFLGRRYAYDDPAAMTPITILVDEFSNIAYPGFIDALNKGGGAKAQFVLAMQSLADPESTMRRDGTQRVLDNLNAKVWFRLADDATAKLATEGLGYTSVRREDITYSLNFGGDSSTSAASRGAIREAEVMMFRSEWLTAMPTGEALVRRRGENLKLRVPLLLPVSRTELVAIAEAYGLGKVLAAVQPGAVAGADKAPASGKGVAVSAVAGASEPLAGVKVRVSEAGAQGGVGERIVEDRLAAALGGVEGPVEAASKDAVETAAFD